MCLVKESRDFVLRKEKEQGFPNPSSSKGDVMHHAIVEYQNACKPQRQAKLTLRRCAYKRKGSSLPQASDSLSWTKSSHYNTTSTLPFLRLFRWFLRLRTGKDDALRFSSCHYNLWQCAISTSRSWPDCAGSRTLWTLWTL